MPEAETKPTIYLFTTTRWSLYKRDLLNVCCFPDGWKVEFGYKKEYVPATLAANYETKLKGHPAVIVYCERQLNGGDTYYRYHPVRRATITDVQKDLADSLTVCIKLGNVFDYFAGDHADRVNNFQSFVDNSTDRPQTRKSERTSKRPSFFLRSSSSTALPDDYWQAWDRHWHSLVSYLGKLTDLDDSFFLRQSLLEGAAVKARKKRFPSVATNLAGRPVWELKAGETYDICLEVRVGTKSKQTTPQISTRGELVNVLGPFERQSGEGTEVDFLIAPRRLFQKDYSLFVIRVEPDKDGKARSPEISGVLSVTPKGWLLPTTLALLVGGSVVLSLDSGLLERWFGRPDAMRTWDGSVALWFFKAVGSAMLAYGAFLGFHKLPMKG